MKVSIITIAYNSAETIEATIQSVLAQDYSEIEYIIIDGDSSDDTMKIVDRYRDKIATIISEKDEGIYDAMNKGVSLASGEFIGILNSDDLYAHNSVISAVVEKIEKENADALYADLVYVDRVDDSKVVRYWKSKQYIPGAFKKGWMPPHPTFFLKKELYDKYGAYNTEFKISADYELMLRMIHKNNVSLTYLQETIVKMRVGGESNVSVKNRMNANKEDRIAWKINGLKPAPFLAVRKPLRKLSQFIKKG